MASHSEENRALAEARRHLKSEKGPPPTGYQPPVQALPGKRVKILDGQLDLDGNEHRP
jgi:hypothetical protein